VSRARASRGGDRAPAARKATVRRSPSPRRVARGARAARDEEDEDARATMDIGAVRDAVRRSVERGRAAGTMTTETREDETDGYRARVDVVYARLSGGDARDDDDKLRVLLVRERARARDARGDGTRRDAGLTRRRRRGRRRDA